MIDHINSIFNSLFISIFPHILIFCLVLPVLAYILSLFDRGN